MTELKNMPVIKLAIVGVSRDCFPAELTRTRLSALGAQLKKASINAYCLSTIIENENDTLAALAEAEDKGCNAAVIYLGNFGPEGPLSIFAQRFGGPSMLCAAAEEHGNNLINGRGDAFCGMLNASYNMGLRSVPVHIPKIPVQTPAALVSEIAHFVTVARTLVAIQSLKIFSFGPRPQDFLACNAPIKPLYDLGVEIMENSELDLYDIYRSAEGDKRIPVVAGEMARELGKGNTYPDLLVKMAQYEVALVNFMEKNLGSSEYGIFANKCWPSFEKYFTFVPCFVNSRLAGRGIPVSCEVDIYGALSEYICQCATLTPATLLDINNTVPADMISKKTNLKNASPEDLFMGFHCGNTTSSCMKNYKLKFQLIMNRLMEDPKKKPDITRGTLEGQLKPGGISMFRLQSNAEGELKSYIANGYILDIDPKSFGGIGIIAIKDFARFYRNVLLEKRYPHHAAIAFEPCGKTLFDVVRYIGLDDIATPLPASIPYPGENPFTW